MVAIGDPIELRELQSADHFGDGVRHAQDYAGRLPICPDRLPGQHQRGAGEGNRRALGKGIAPGGAPRGLERALAKSRTQPQVGDAIGFRENNLAPVSFITRTRNAEGLVVATRQTDTPRPHWVIEKLEDFDLRAAAARALRDPTLSRREAVINHRELGPAYWILDAAQKYATGRWESPKTREAFVAAVRETLALTVERGIELPETAREAARSAVAPNGLQRSAARTRE